MGQKLSSKLLFIYSPYSDRFYIFYISQGSVATQLRCGGIFSNHFITNFRQNAPVKNFDNRSIFDKDMDKTLWLTFLGPPCTQLHTKHNFLIVVYLTDTVCRCLAPYSRFANSIRLCRYLTPRTDGLVICDRRTDRHTHILRQHSLPRYT